PTSAVDVRRLARTLGMTPEQFTTRYQRTRRRVRQLHEEIFYRPLLVTSSRLSDGQITLSPQAAKDRLAAIGYRDGTRALSHISSLTEGISRRAAIQRQPLPAMLEWFADGIDPDLGLLQFRRLSDAIGSAHWYLGLLRDSGRAAKRLTRVLAGSRFVGEQLEQIPEGVRWLARDELLRPMDRAVLRRDLLAVFTPVDDVDVARDVRRRHRNRELQRPLARDVLGREFLAVITRVDDVDVARDVLRRTRNRELLRISLAHLSGLVGPIEVARALTDLAEAVLEAGMLVACHVVARE